MPSIKGTSSMADARAHDKLLRSTKFPSIFYNTTIDFSKVNKAIVNVWIDREITALLGFEDEIVSNTATNLFCLTDTPSNSAEGSSSIAESFDPRNAHIVLSGFLGEDASLKFCTKLLELLLDASQQPMGIPRQLIEEKKQQLMMAASTSAPVVQTAASIPAPSIQQNNQKRSSRWDNNNKDMASGARSDRGEDMEDHGNQAKRRPSIDEYGRRHREERNSVAVVEAEPNSPASVERDRDTPRSRSRHRDDDDYRGSSSRRRHREEERHRRHDNEDERRRRHQEERYRRPNDEDYSSDERHRRRSDREYKRSRHNHRPSRDDYNRSRRGSSPDHSDREYSGKRHHRYHDRDRSP